MDKLLEAVKKALGQFQDTVHGDHHEKPKMKSLWPQQYEELAAVVKEMEGGNGNGEDTALLGSDAFPSVVTIGDNDVQLGEIIKAAAERAEKSPKQWNRLSQKTRDGLIEQEIEAMRRKA